MTAFRDALTATLDSTTALLTETDHMKDRDDEHAYCAGLERETKESKVLVEIDLDGSGRTEISTGVGFYDHMLTAFGRHALFDLKVITDGDTHIDAHHTVEDTAIVLGDALPQDRARRQGRNPSLRRLAGPAGRGPGAVRGGRLRPPVLRAHRRARRGAAVRHGSVDALPGFADPARLRDAGAPRPAGVARPGAIRAAIRTTSWSRSSRPSLAPCAMRSPSTRGRRACPRPRGTL